MTYFKQLFDLPILDLEQELTNMVSSNKIDWDGGNQICLNTLPSHPSDYLIGTGSLMYDWENKTKIINSDGTVEYKVPERTNPRKESDFSVLCDIFQNTYFETVYNAIQQKYKIGRVRLMKMKPKTCLSWHMDDCIRLHYPIRTDEGCMMIIDKEVKHMPNSTWWLTDTLPYHTAINASKIDRIHLVASVLE